MTEEKSAATFLLCFGLGGDELEEFWWSADFCLYGTGGTLLHTFNFFIWLGKDKFPKSMKMENMDIGGIWIRKTIPCSLKYSINI